MNSLLLAPIVVSQRLPLLWLEAMGFASPGRKESERMVTEKVDAMSEGVVAAQMQMVRTSIAINTAFWTGQSPVAAAIRGTQRVARAAVLPGHRKMRSNIKRLSISK